MLYPLSNIPEMVEIVGIEPTIHSCVICCLCLYLSYIYKAFHGLDPGDGFEPTTFWLWAKIATSASPWDIYKAHFIKNLGCELSFNKFLLFEPFMVIPRGVEPRSWEWKSHVLTTRLRDHFLWIHSAELSDTTWRRILCRQLSRRRAKGSNKKEKQIKAPLLYLCSTSWATSPSAGKIGVEPMTIK